MRIGLVSALMKDNDIEHQIEVMETYLRQNSRCYVFYQEQIIKHLHMGQQGVLEVDLKDILAGCDLSIPRKSML